MDWQNLEKRLIRFAFSGGVSVIYQFLATQVTPPL